MTRHTWTERYFVRRAVLREAMRIARDRAMIDHPDTTREAMMVPSAGRRVRGMDIVYGWDVTVIGKPRGTGR